MRGLNTFITDIRHCPNKETEQKRCEKELAKIRNKFASNKGLSGYQKKKYVWKLLYMHILGYEIDFGYFESANLINCPKFSEKYSGYVATGILVNENNTDLYKTITNSIQADLLGSNEINQSLALAMIGSLAPQELVENLHGEVAKIALSENTRYSLFVRKKAILCLLRIYRKYREKFNPAEWASGALAMFNQKYLSLGFLSAVCSFVLGIVNFFPPSSFEELIGKVVKLLHKLVINKDCSQDYLYYSTPNPWLQVKLLKILQEFPPPTDPNTYQILMDVLMKVIKKTEVTKTVNKNNADHGILFEAANLIISYKNSVPPDLRNETITLLGIFITVREPNIRYLALESMCKFNATPASIKIITDHLPTILKSLRDNDISIRRRALDILYLMCTNQTAAKIVEDLMQYVDESDLLFREELVLKIAILAEKFADDLQWYIDVVVRLVTTSGEYVTDDIWYRIIQIITGFGSEASPDLQRYACAKLYTALNVPHVHETLVKIAAFVMSEYSHFLIDSGKDPKKIYDTLNRHFMNCSEKGKAILLSAYIKLANKYEDLVDEIQAMFLLQGEHFDPDIQQRAVEYLQISNEDAEIRNQILAKAPPFSEDIQNNNPLMKRICQLKLTGTEKAKDPTLMNQAKRMAEDADKFQNRKVEDNEEIVNRKQEQSGNEGEYIQFLKSHPLFDFCADRICTKGNNIVAPPLKLFEDNANIINQNEIKELLTQPNGLVLDTADLQIQYKSDFQGNTSRIAMQFESKKGAMSNVSLMIGNANGMLFNISPVKYAEHPQIMVQVMSVDPVQTLPIGTLFYNLEGLLAQQKIDFALPIYSHKFITPVDMPKDAFDKFFDEYSNSNNPNYFKLDYFIKNPAPPQVPLSEVLKKFGALLNNGLNLKANPHPDINNLKALKAPGQFCFKNEGGTIVNLPVMVEVETYEECPQNFRVSLRGAGNAGVIRNMWQIITLYLG